MQKCMPYEVKKNLVGQYHQVLGMKSPQVFGVSLSASKTHEGVENKGDPPWS